MLSGSIRGSHKLLSLRILCILPCNMFLCCSWEVSPTSLFSTTWWWHWHHEFGIWSSAEWVLCAPAAEISCESRPAGMFSSNHLKRQMFAVEVQCDSFWGSFKVRTQEKVVGSPSEPLIASAQGGLLKLFRKTVECSNVDNNWANSSLWGVSVKQVAVKVASRAVMWDDVSAL